MRPTKSLAILGALVLAIVGVSTFRQCTHAETQLLDPAVCEAVDCHSSPCNVNTHYCCGVNRCCRNSGTAST